MKATSITAAMMLFLATPAWVLAEEQTQAIEEQAVTIEQQTVTTEAPPVTNITSQTFVPGTEAASRLQIRP